MHDQLMAVIARPTCSLVLMMAVVCCFLRVGRTFDEETVVGMASGLRERLRYLLLCHQIYGDTVCRNHHTFTKNHPYIIPSWNIKQQMLLWAILFLDN